ncbi:uncharacterized protein A4U43_C01F17200 [Asparagus officinalis]|uniref:Uncharacterized protein n=1 Tax=Asparagus officinalis TaxID=4686 RepID=A0A5P1FQ08_ASPOF|nr:uncharacterized protein A4U43_C01F17200 [Asparagus officinalis]
MKAAKMEMARSRLRSMEKERISYSEFLKEKFNFCSICQGSRSLDLSNNNIGGTIPENLPLTLKTFFLSANQLTGSIPSSLSKLTLLSDMSVNVNHLSGDLPDAFQSLTGMHDGGAEGNRSKKMKSEDTCDHSDKGEEDVEEEEARKNRLGLNKNSGDDDELIAKGKFYVNSCRLFPLGKEWDDESREKMGDVMELIKKELDPENYDEFDVFVKSHKRKRGLEDYPHEDTKDVCEKVIERAEELKIQLQNADPATKAHRLKLLGFLDEVARKNHKGYERGYGAGYKGRTMVHHFSTSYKIEGNVNNNSELQEQLHSANQKIEELQKRAKEAKREKEREREERDRQMQDFQKMVSGFQAMIGLNGQAQ